MIDGYRAVTTTATPLIETPQLVQIIPQELLRDQGPTSMAETLRDVRGVRGNPALQMPASESTLIRDSLAKFARDG